MRSAVWAGVDEPITQPFIPGTHDGIDIGCSTGTTIYAARSGVVERVQTGMTSIHVDNSNERDFYLHGTSLVSVGQYVRQGQPVITSDTVQVDPRYPLTGPHLHFERQNGFTYPGAPPFAEGAPLDPVPVLLAAQPLQEDDMLYLSPTHPLQASLRAYRAGSYYLQPFASLPPAGAVTVDAVYAVDGYAWSSSSVQASTPPEPDSLWWHAKTGGWVPDALLDTSGLTGAPGPAWPAGEPVAVLYDAPTNRYIPLAPGGPDDDSAYTTKAYVDTADAAVKAAIPTKATTTLG